MNTSATTPISFTKRMGPKPSEAFDTYWKFAAKRQEAFFARVENTQPPWSTDPILREYKFTNAYRASDRVSQYLIKNVIYSKKWSLGNTVFRVLLFKLFNKIETWELLESQIGEISLDTFDIDRYDKELEKAKASGGTIYSAAYIIPSGPKSKYQGVKKHRFHLELIDLLIKDNFPRVIHGKKSLQECFNTMLTVESLGNFLAYQFVIDLNYSPWFNHSESEFIIPGPGALDGIRKCFASLGDYSEADVISKMVDEQELHFERLGIDFRSLWGRRLQLIDCQNLFCEVDKYSRVAHPDIAGISGRTRIKQKFKPRASLTSVWYPPKWGINDKISQDFLVTE